VIGPGQGSTVAAMQDKNSFLITITGYHAALPMFPNNQDNH
jgi:hypothetical protein